MASEILKQSKIGLKRGVSRIILGTIALRDPSFVIAAAKIFPGKIVVGIDARNGMVAVEGWAKTSDMSAAQLGKKFQDAGGNKYYLYRH